jgi:hypothetical protein
MFQKSEHSGQCFTSKVAGSHPQLPGWFCPQIDIENFAENWSEENYKRFRIWQTRVITSIQRLEQAKGLGTDVMLNRLSESFGKDRVIRAAESLGADTRALHDAGELRVVGGTIGADVSAKVPKTIYFGSAK